MKQVFFPGLCSGTEKFGKRGGGDAAATCWLRGRERHGGKDLDAY